MKQLLISLLIALSSGQPGIQLVSPMVKNISQEVLGAKYEILASREMNMEYRYPVPSVSEVFKDNILLNIAYLDGRVSDATEINWDEIDKPFHSEFTLQPNQSFAFHDAILPEYKDKVVVTTNFDNLVISGTGTPTTPPTTVPTPTRTPIPTTPPTSGTHLHRWAIT